MVRAGEVAEEPRREGGSVPELALDEEGRLGGSPNSQIV